MRLRRNKINCAVAEVFSCRPAARRVGSLDFSSFQQQKETQDAVRRDWRYNRGENSLTNQREDHRSKASFAAETCLAIRTQLQLGGRTRDLALFNLAIDSKLRGCDLVRLKVADVAPHGPALTRATIRQRKTKRPVRFELTDHTRAAVDAWLRIAERQPWDYLFPGRGEGHAHLSTQQYARLVQNWIALTGLDPSLYGTHSLRRTKATLIYRKTGNLRAVQLLLGHSKIESTVRYLGVEVDDALEISEHVDV